MVNLNATPKGKIPSFLIVSNNPSYIPENQHGGPQHDAISEAGDTNILKKHSFVVSMLDFAWVPIYRGYTSISKDCFWAHFQPPKVTFLAAEKTKTQRDIP